MSVRLRRDEAGKQTNLFNRNSQFYVDFVSRPSNSLRAGRSRDGILVGERFSTPVQAGSEAQPFSYTIGTGPFPGVKRPGRGVDHPPHLAPRLKKV